MSSILDRFDSFTQWLLNNKFYDEISLSELIVSLTLYNSKNFYE
jgi:hypothetical protein